MFKATRALISVYDKRGVVELAEGLNGLGIEILSTGGTARALEAAGLPVLTVSSVTGFPEILDGRVKTLHPRIHGGILADRAQASHLAALQEHSIAPIDLVVVNLYPFRTAASSDSATFEEVVEMIDIGGPCMVRAAAKNHRGVAVVVNPEDYPQVLAALQDGERSIPQSLLQRLALKAFRHTQAYDAAIAGWLETRLDPRDRRFPGHLFLDLEKDFEPRYGENPHQQAALYRLAGGVGVFGGFQQLHGKELSFNNLLDADAARKLVASIGEPAVVLVKHNNPCGVGRGDDLHLAYQRALECDPVSAFGSIAAVNRQLTATAARAMKELFLEVILAPEFERDALLELTSKPALRILKSPVFEGRDGELDLRTVDGGMLAQTADLAAADPSRWTCATQRQPSGAELAALELMWTVARHVRSNAVVIGNDKQTVGIGAGQMSRVDACRLAIDKAALATAGCVAASDAFFPFADGLELLAEAGIAAVAQPGGSKRDREVVEAADRRGMAMLLTGTRHFKH